MRKKKRRQVVFELTSVLIRVLPASFDNLEGREKQMLNPIAEKRKGANVGEDVVWFVLASK